jgi:hypothetical protein
MKNCLEEDIRRKICSSPVDCNMLRVIKMNVGHMILMKTVQYTNVYIKKTFTYSVPPASSCRARIFVTVTKFSTVETIEKKVT